MQCLRAALHCPSLDYGGSLSLHFTGHFPGGLGLAVTRKSPFWILMDLRVMEEVTIGAPIGAKLH